MSVQTSTEEPKVITTFNSLLSEVQDASLQDLKILKKRFGELTKAVNHAIKNSEKPSEEFDSRVISVKCCDLTLKITLIVGIIFLAIGAFALTAALLPNVATIPFFSSVYYAASTIAAAFGSTEFGLSVFTIGLGGAMVLTGGLGLGYNWHKTKSDQS